MTQGIERRLKRDMFAFLVADRTYFEQLARHKSSNSDDYRAAIETHLSVEWRLIREGLWYNAIRNGHQVPAQGFKIHVSATSCSARQILECVVPLCVASGTPFKALADSSLLDFCNSKNYSRASSGKFVTIYPDNDHACGNLLQRLHEATRGMIGPYILSDRPFEDSRVVFYRYGGFRPRFALNLFGERVSMITSIDGSTISDLRMATFHLPAGIQDPFTTSAAAHSGPVLLKQRYQIEAVLRYSNSGGVYTALDRETGAKVVVKEARPIVGMTRDNPVDAAATLHKEATVLEAMDGTPYAPRIIERFQEWEHQFLVEEFVDGILLSSFRALEDVGLIVQRTVSGEHVDGFCRRLGIIALNLIDAVCVFHERGIVIGDLAPSNVFVDRETLALKIIDFEGAFLQGATATSALSATVTSGFISPRRLTGAEPKPVDDFYSLGALLYSLLLPVQALFTLSPEAERAFLESLVRDFDLPSDISELIGALAVGDIARARTAAGALSGTQRSDWHMCLTDPARASTEDVRRTLEGIGEHILNCADTSREDRLWPADYRVFTTNPLSLAYGALGIATFLKELTGAIPEQLRAWIVRQPLSLDTYPAGLYSGLAGIAWGLDLLSLREKALEAIELAHVSPLAHAGPDVFFGSAGLGLANLYFWGQSRDKRFLARAAHAANSLDAAATWDANGCYWRNADGEHYYGYAHGGSGIALFLLRLHQATGVPRFLELGVAALDHEIAQAIERDGHAVWPRSESDALISPYWRYGAAGIGSVLVRFHHVLKEDRYLRLAEKAARYVATKYAVLPGQFVGLSGMGEFLLDMHHFTGAASYLEDAWRLADGVLLYRAARGTAIAFPGEELVRLSTDFGTGSAGVGHFLLRLSRPGGRLYYEFNRPDQAAVP